METLETSVALFLVIRPNQSFAYYLRMFKVSLGPAAQLHGEHFPQHGLFQLCWKSIQAVLCPSSSLFSPHQNDNLRCVSMFSLMRQEFFSEQNLLQKMCEVSVQLFLSIPELHLLPRLQMHEMLFWILPAK